jgi:3-phenylpropionate/trans-cinnamate dioxygenase ferredoxin reductase component
VTESGSIVIVGGGHAGAQLCAGLAEAGLGPRVHLVCEEAQLPYQRPPLSKAYLKNPDELLQEHRTATWFAEQGINVHRADAVTSIDRAARTVTLRSGAALPYARLVLATGTRARQLHGIPPGLANVAVVRSAADAERMRGLLADARHVTVLGGGFIGLEVAATSRVLGKTVTVLEAAPRLLSRSVSPELAEHVLRTHRASGIDLRVGVSTGHFEVEGERLVALTVDTVREPVEILVLGVGAVPETSLAEAAGLTCGNGILVDACMRTSDPAILAIGDCTSFPTHRQAQHAGGRLRLESVQNANDQARTATATLQGREEPFHALPWFWSEQGSMRLQMAGLMPTDGTRFRRPGASEQSFSILHYVGVALRCVESVNAPMDHMMARKLLEAGRSPDPAQACDPAKPLKSFL